MKLPARKSAFTQLPREQQEVVAVKAAHHLPDRALIEAELMTRSLHAYMKGMWHIVEPGRPFDDNWHIGAMCEVLEAVTRFELRTVIINVPPRSTKSLTVCVAWPTWVWTQETMNAELARRRSIEQRRFLTPQLGASARWLCTSHDADLATRDAVHGRRVIESDWYQRRWGHLFTIMSDQNAKEHYENDKTGYRITETVGGSVIGKGGDFRVIDDPHKTDTQEGEGVREKKLMWLREEFSTRYIDPNKNAIVLIMQRLHERDMAGYMLAEGWADYHLCVPMRFEKDREIYLPGAKQ